ncbi:hypothetical protein DSO57_1027942 [Entomophthora muscae]|uniref:Uncharacterized protein n=1 Tax=Entomophthora muscae TaxID=34485 RepID=A0ACC2T1I7_9FUNG|nr:hypothetical protein DSO57_1027942 [Entomophthora muscae]
MSKATISENTCENADEIQLSDESTADFQFRTLLSNVQLIKGLESRRYFQASKIQALVFKKADLSRSCVIQAKAGTGKTLAFSCATLDSFIPSLKKDMVQVLVVTPTHEIARQVADILRDITKYFVPIPPSIQVFVGGQNKIEDTKNGLDCHIAVGTPGRLNAMITSKQLNTSVVETLIFDEADRLMNHIFMPDLTNIYKSLPKSTRVLAASATFEASALSVLETNFLPDNAQYLMVDGQDVNLEGIRQFSLLVKLEPTERKCTSHMLDYQLFQKKTDTLIEALSKIKFYQAIVFLNKESRSTELVNKLSSMGWPAAYTSGKTSKMERLKAMAKTRSFDVRVLVCSDLIARGVDVDRVDLVINLDMPPSADTYLHRVGRTGRFGTEGIAISLIGSEDEVAAIKIFQDAFEMSILQITAIDQINHSAASSRKLQREDVLAFSRLKTIREKRKDHIPDDSDSTSKPKVTKTNHSSIEHSLSAPLLYTPQSPTNYHSYSGHVQPQEKNQSQIEVTLATSQCTFPHENPFLKFWWNHFSRK